MKFSYILGVDMSKSWFHFCLKDKELNVIWEGEVDNRPDDILKFIALLKEKLKVKSLDAFILCMEHTGIYVQHLMKSWMMNGGRLSLIAATKISDYLAGAQGWAEKDDRIDARRIAEYGVRYSDKLKLAEFKSETLEKLQRFTRQRERLIKVINLLETPIKESEQFDTAFISEAIKRNQEKSLRALKSDLKTLEKELTKVVEEDLIFKQLFKLITSVEGVGPVIAREMIITTAGFTKFSPSEAKKYARYSGLAPLKHRSGSSVRKRNKTSNRANKKMKSLLSMGALSLIKTSSELAQYYERKIGEGKEHLVVLNSMRNKIVHRIFAVVRNQVMYEKNLNICLD